LSSYSSLSSTAEAEAPDNETAGSGDTDLLKFIKLTSGSHPVIKPWITIPTIFEITQYRASPLGNCIEKNPNIRGIIHSIILLVDACLSSAAGIIVIFCIRNIETPTIIGSTGKVSGRAKFNHKKELSKGITSFIMGIQGYKLVDSPTKLSGVDGTVFMIA